MNLFPSYLENTILIYNLIFAYGIIKTSDSIENIKKLLQLMEIIHR